MSAIAKRKSQEMRQWPAFREEVWRRDCDGDLRLRVEIRGSGGLARYAFRKC
jgi:hypothetical protein